MSTILTRVEIRFEQDVVYARQRARLIAELLGFERQDQIRLSTAVSEISRNAHQYAQGGEVVFSIESAAPSSRFDIVVRDHGPGIENLDAILEGNYISRTGMGRGIAGSRRLLDPHFQIETEPDRGTTVTFGKMLPATAPPITPAVLQRVAEALAATRSESPLAEIRTQNQELLAALDQLRQRDEELSRVNRELTETNAGMAALNTELAANAEKLQQSDQLLRARNEELKGFAYTISHDLKAPLRGIAGYSEELERKHKAGLSERALFCLSQILTATHNLDRLIEDLLHYARLDAEMPSLTDVNLSRVVDSILKDRALIIAEQHAEVTVDISCGTLRTWERGLLQVLTNLIDNALKYSRKAEPPRIAIKAEMLADTWRLCVTDNGIGFDMQYHDRLFGLFNRLVRMDEFEGTGAGLAIVKRIVDKQGGRIWAESQPGAGAKFCIELPQEKIRG